jgi:uncharacterized protein YceH (UPF0502 family)
VELRAEEARVLACLIEKEEATPEQYPLTLNALRLACNQATNRHPVVAFDDRTVEGALMQLRSTGLVRFVLPSSGGRTTRYRHTADERWRLDRGELAVLAALVLRGQQTIGELRAKVVTNAQPVEELLDTLAARAPEPFAERLERRQGEREPRWAHLLCGPADAAEPLSPADAVGAPSGADEPPVDPDRHARLEEEVAELRARLDRLERLLGVDS